MSSEELFYLPATELIRRFRAKSLSPVEVMQAYIERIEAVEPIVNALSHRFDDSAMQQAREAEQRYVKGETTRPLEGIPVAIKDESSIEGMPCTSGSLINQDFIADSTSIDAGRIIDAGGIVHARSRTPEFSCAGYTHSKLGGVTRNPWSSAFTPGGSTGGGAAALAAGTCALASGSDIGGSIRIPASCSGVVGFKPPYGRNAADAPFNLDTYCHTGPLARNVADTILLQNVVSGPHPQDIASIKPKLVLPETYPSIEGWKIAYSIDLGLYQVDEEVRQNTLAALELLRDLGAEVEEVEIDWPSDLIRAGLDYLEHFFGVYISQYLEQYEQQMTSYAREFALAAKRATPEKYFHSLEVATEMYSSFGPLMERYQLFVCPTTAIPAVAADHDQSRDQVVINGVEVDPILGWVMTLPFNMMSRCPVLSLPSGRASNGVPTGIQLVGPTYADEAVFQAGCAYEKAFGEWYLDSDKRPDITAAQS